MLEQRAAANSDRPQEPALIQTGDDIRPITEYLTFFEQYAEGATPITTTERSHHEPLRH